MQALRKFLNVWIWLNNSLWQGSQYVWSTFHRLLNKPQVLNMLGLRIWHGHEYARVTQCWICLNNPEYALIMFNMQFSNALITLNMIEYDGIYLKNRVLNMPEFWMCLMQYIAKGHCTNYCAVIEIERRIQNTTKHLRWSALQNNKIIIIIIPECRGATQNFSGQGGGGGFWLVELGHFDKDFLKNTRKNGLLKVHFE